MWRWFCNREGGDGDYVAGIEECLGFQDEVNEFFLIKIKLIDMFLWITR